MFLLRGEFVSPINTSSNKHYSVSLLISLGCPPQAPPRDITLPRRGCVPQLVSPTPLLLTQPQHLSPRTPPACTRPVSSRVERTTSRTASVGNGRRRSEQHYGLLVGSLPMVRWPFWRTAPFFAAPHPRHPARLLVFRKIAATPFPILTL